MGLFSRGGLVVDGGRPDELKPAPIIRHLPLPRHWRVLVILDPQRQGVHGPEEGAAIAALPPMSEADAAQLCRLILMKALPALVEDDLANFGAAIKELQIRLGDYFAPVQGGTRFMSPDVAAVLDALDSAGARGIGQSSWGPTGFAFAPNPDRLSPPSAPIPISASSCSARHSARLLTRQPPTSAPRWSTCCKALTSKMRIWRFVPPLHRPRLLDLDGRAWAGSPTALKVSS